ncbi:hypothetical protein K9N68_19335 [Kovacikia minuta CCNUW1]|uniref:hypothetical protein n=1 Tax=Kovacikia minuta TaxID=2931930 RepID=UPI001CCDAA58|nr:hypothetical protein [Kovacikia minuta]UBF23900.1 hypothetical protein K9N68_19335 [Kovacikia minuta CCNUW1]
MSGATLAIFSNHHSLQKGWLSGRVLQILLAIAGGIGFGGVLPVHLERAIAAEPKPEPAPTVDIFPDPQLLDLKLLTPGNIPADAVTATTISATGLTIPSLWWARDQYAARKKYGSRLIENWIAYPVQSDRPNQVDFVVNRQLWNQLDYLQRYSFLHEFGAVVGSYGYNLRVFDNQANFLAAYTCNFSAAPRFNPAQTTPPLPAGAASGNATAPLFSSYVQPSAAHTCYSFLDFGGKASLRGYPSQSGEGSSKGFDTAQP